MALERADSVRNSITASTETFGFSSGQADKMNAALSNVDEAIERLRRSTDAYGDAFLEIEDFITEIQRRDMQAGKVLRLTYIERLSVADIAKNEEIRCSKKNVYELLKRGLDIAFEVLGEEDE